MQAKFCYKRKNKQNSPLSSILSKKNSLQFYLFSSRTGNEQPTLVVGHQDTGRKSMYTHQTADFKNRSVGHSAYHWKILGSPFSLGWCFFMQIHVLISVSRAQQSISKKLWKCPQNKSLWYTFFSVKSSKPLQKTMFRAHFFKAYT